MILLQDIAWHGLGQYMSQVEHTAIVSVRSCSLTCEQGLHTHFVELFMIHIYIYIYTHAHIILKFVCQLGKS